VATRTTVPVPATAVITGGGVAYFIDGKPINSALTEINIEDLSGYTQGYIIRGGVVDWEAYAANDDGEILIGDGSDINSVAVSGDVTLVNTGAVTVNQVDDGTGDKFTIALDANRSLSLSGGSPTITGGGTLALGGFTLTVEAAGRINQDVTTDGGPTFANVYLADGAFVGVSGGAGWTFDDAGGDVTTSAKVGIGKIVPGYALDIGGSATIGIRYDSSAHAYIRADAAAGFQAAFSLAENNTQRGIFVYDTGANLMSIGTSETGAQIQIMAGFWSEAIRINGSGDVGIGEVLPDRRLHATESDAVTAAITYVQRITHETSGTAAAGFGAGIEAELESTTTNRLAGALSWEWGVATDAIRASEGALSAYYIGAEETPVEWWADTDGGHAGFGDRAGGHYTEVKPDGEIVRHGDARTENDVWVSAAGIKAPGSKPATFVELGLDGAWSYSDEGIAANQQQTSAQLRVARRMDRTVAPTFCVGWSADGISPGDVKWQLELLWRSENEDMTAAAEQTLTVVDTASATSNGLNIATITGINAPSTTDACLTVRLTRLSADAADTISDSAELIGVMLSFTADKLGTPL